jgi:hypothetical protein
MSGRVISGYREDGSPIRGYRKTDRRQRQRPFIDRINELNDKFARRNPTKWSPEVRIGFLLPRDIAAFVSPGAHGIGVYVHRGGFVQITNGSSFECFQSAIEFFAAVAKNRPAFSVLCSVRSTSMPDRHYCRYLSVVNGAMVESPCHTAPHIYEARG